MSEPTNTTDRALDLAGRMKSEGASKEAILAAVAEIAPPPKAPSDADAVEAAQQ